MYTFTVFTTVTRLTLVENADVRTWNCGQRARKTQPLPHYKPWAYTSSPAFFLIHGDGFTGLYTGVGGCTWMTF